MLDIHANKIIANKFVGEFENNNDYVIESYNDENGNWYRLYKSGWVEQGGFLLNEQSVLNLTINLLKPFVNEKYAIISTTVQKTAYTSNTELINVDACTARAGVLNRKTATTFTISSYSKSFPISWCACGQGQGE